MLPNSWPRAYCSIRQVLPQVSMPDCATTLGLRTGLRTGLRKGLCTSNDSGGVCADSLL